MSAKKTRLFFLKTSTGRTPFYNPKCDSKMNTMYTLKTDNTRSKSPKSPKHLNKNKTTVNFYGPFLSSKAKEEPKVEIKNQQIKKLMREIDNYGPYYSHCPSHNKRNLEFFGNMKPDNSIKLLSYLKEYRNNN